MDFENNINQRLMKRLMLMAVCSALCMHSAFAQAEDELLVAKLKKEEVPAVIIQSVERDFPEMAVTAWNAIPVSMYGEELIVRSSPPNKNYDTYSITLSGKGLNSQATYDKHGNLLHFTEWAKNIPLPEPVEKSIGMHFPGWAVVGDKEHITVKRGNHKRELYKVQLEQNKERQHVVMDARGNIMKQGGEGMRKAEKADTK